MQTNKIAGFTAPFKASDHYTGQPTPDVYDATGSLVASVRGPWPDPATAQLANLLAAAPAMLAALEGAYDRLAYLAPERFDDEDHEAEWTQFLDSVSDAIRAATNGKCLNLAADPERAELGRAIIAEHLVEGGPGDPDRLELAATLCNFAPAMLAALQVCANALAKYAHIDEAADDAADDARNVIAAATNGESLNLAADLLAPTDEPARATSEAAPDLPELTLDNMSREAPEPDGEPLGPWVLHDYRSLAAGLREMIEANRLTAADLPDDFAWIEAKLLYLAHHDKGAADCDALGELRARFAPEGEG